MEEGGGPAFTADARLSVGPGLVSWLGTVEVTEAGDVHLRGHPSVTRDIRRDQVRLDVDPSGVLAIAGADGPPVHVHFYGDGVRRQQVLRGAIGLVFAVALALPVWPDGPYPSLGLLVALAAASSVTTPQRTAELSAPARPNLLEVAALHVWDRSPMPDRLGSPTTPRQRWAWRGIALATVCGATTLAAVFVRPVTMPTWAAFLAVGSALLAVRFGTWPHWRRTSTRVAVVVSIAFATGILIPGALQALS